MLSENSRRSSVGGGMAMPLAAGVAETRLARAKAVAGSPSDNANAAAGMCRRPQVSLRKLMGRLPPIEGASRFHRRPYSSLGFSDVTRHDGGPRAFFDHHPAAAFVVLEIGPIAFPCPGDVVMAKRGLAMRHARCGRADHRVGAVAPAIASTTKIAASRINACVVMAQPPSPAFRAGRHLRPMRSSRVTPPARVRRLNDVALRVELSHTLESAARLATERRVCIPGPPRLDQCSMEMQPCPCHLRPVICLRH